MEKVINEQEVNQFLSQVENTFPNFVAGIITDRNGFPIGLKIPNNIHIDENDLALSAITSNRDFIKDDRFLKVKRSLDKKNNVRLFLLLDKSSQYINRFKHLKDIIDTQKLF